VRAGAALPTSAVAQDTAQEQKLPLIVSVAVGGAGATAGGEIYQDSGDGPATDAERTTLTVDGDRLRIAAPKTSKFRRIGAIEFIGVDTRPRAVRIDGKARTDFEYDAAAHRVRVTIPAEAPHEVAVVR